MKEISDITPYTKPMEIVQMPAARIVGSGIRSGGKLGNAAPAHWDKVYASGEADALKALPRIGRCGLFGWTCEFDPADSTFVYMVCALTPAGTAVPQGFTFRDIPGTLCAVGRFGESVNQTVKRAAGAGYAVNWSAPGCGWNAELYFDEEEAAPPKKNCKPWHWLVPVREAERE